MIISYINIFEYYSKYLKAQCFPLFDLFNLQRICYSPETQFPWLCIVPVLWHCVFSVFTSCLYKMSLYINFKVNVLIIFPEQSCHAIYIIAILFELFFVLFCILMFFICYYFFSLTFYNNFNILLKVILLLFFSTKKHVWYISWIWHHFILFHFNWWVIHSINYKYIL